MRAEERADLKRRQETDRREFDRFLKKTSGRARYQAKFKRAVGRKQFQKVRG